MTAPPQTRQGRVAAILGVDEKEAARAVKRSDAARADYIKRFYGIGAELPTHYDLVINTEKLAPERAAGLIVQAAGERGDARAWRSPDQWLQLNPRPSPACAGLGRVSSARPRRPTVHDANRSVRPAARKATVLWQDRVPRPSSDLLRSRARRRCRYGARTAGFAGLRASRWLRRRRPHRTIFDSPPRLADVLAMPSEAVVSARRSRPLLIGGKRCGSRQPGRRKCQPDLDPSGWAPPGLRSPSRLRSSQLGLEVKRTGVWGPIWGPMCVKAA